MKLLSNISGKVIVLAFVVIVAMLIVLAVLFSPTSNPPGTNPAPPPTTVDVISPDNPIKAEDYPYIGIKSNDTLAVTNNKDKVVVINLDHRLWQHISWSPDGKMLAALGQSNAMAGKGIYDLYTYTLANNSWKQLTFFGNGEDTGISGYDWMPDGNLVFTQGADPNDWVHIYNVTSGELKKVYRVTGTLQYYSGNSNLAVIRTDSGSESKPAYNYELRKADGSILITFSSNLSANPATRLLSILRGRNDNEFVIGNIKDKTGATISYQAWSLENPELKDLNLTQNPATIGTSLTGSAAASAEVVAQTAVSKKLDYIALCAASPSLYWGYVNHTAGNGFDVIDFSIDYTKESQTYHIATQLEPEKAAAIDSSKTFCANSKAILDVQSTAADKTAVNTWYLLQDDKLTELPLLQGFTSVAVR